MPIERNRHGHPFMLLRIRHGLANHLLMAEMDAIEHADGQ
jgi:hypothetical protein